ncbi:MAG: regulatory protein RecX [Bdellovibrionales bacterium]
MDKKHRTSPNSKRSSPPDFKEKSDSAELALERCMQYMAARDHSEKELQKKLKRRFTPEAVESALATMKKHNWLPEPEILAQRVTDTLHRKKKGHLYIKNYLQQIGLKATARDSEKEIQKAQQILEKKFPKVEAGSQSDNLDFTAHQKLIQKMMRFLSARGFDSEIVRKVVYDWSRN